MVEPLKSYNVCISPKVFVSITRVGLSYSLAFHFDAWCNKVPKISGLSKKFCSKKRKNYLRIYCVNTKLHMYKTVLSLSV